MRSFPSLVTVALVTAIVAGPALARHMSPDEELADALKGRIAGKPVQCIDMPRIYSSQIIEGTAIVYTVGSTIYVNRPVGAETLRNDDILVTHTFGSNLCRMDQVRLLDAGSRMTRSVVGLNEFVPYKRAS